MSYVRKRIYFGCRMTEGYSKLARHAKSEEKLFILFGFHSVVLCFMFMMFGIAELQLPQLP